MPQSIRALRWQVLLLAAIEATYINGKPPWLRGSKKSQFVVIKRAEYLAHIKDGADIEGLALISISAMF